MEAFAPFLMVLSVVLPLSVSSVLIAKIYRKNAALDPKITIKLRKQQEDYINEVEKKNRSLNSKLNSMQKGPSIEDTGDSMGMLPEILTQVEQFAPKWLAGTIKTIKNNPDAIKIVKEYAEKNPDTTKKFIESIVSKFTKNKPPTAGSNGAAVSGL